MLRWSRRTLIIVTVSPPLFVLHWNGKSFGPSCRRPRHAVHSGLDLRQTDAYPFWHSPLIRLTPWCLTTAPALSSPGPRQAFFDPETLKGSNKSYGVRESTFRQVTRAKGCLRFPGPYGHLLGRLGTKMTRFRHMRFSHFNQTPFMDDISRRRQALGEKPMLLGGTRKPPGVCTLGTSMQPSENTHRSVFWHSNLQAQHVCLGMFQKFAWSWPVAASDIISAAQRRPVAPLPGAQCPGFIIALADINPVLDMAVQQM